MDKLHLMTEVIPQKDMESERKNEDIIKLNMGGRPFYATYGTLKVSPYFKSLLDSNVNNLCFVNGDEIFLDRTPSLFIDIMHYLRNNEVNFNEKDDLPALKGEAEYYGLYDLAALIDDVILNPSSEKEKKYELIDYTDLNRLSAITKQGTNTVISDTYDIISTYTYYGSHYECDYNGPISKCRANCKGPYTSVWNSNVFEKLLVVKK